MKTNRIISIVCALTIIAIAAITIASSVGYEKFVGVALINKTTGKLIEYVNTDFDSNGNPLSIPLGTLSSNAIKSGFAASNIEERFVTKTEADILLQAQSEDSMRRYRETYQQEVNAGNIGGLKAPLVTELNSTYTVGGIVLYTDNYTYYKAPDGWHFMNGTITK